ncbi:MAG: hypothetical protein U0269_19740 [Polyangiales bacterium]
MNEQWTQAIERWRDAKGRQARIEAERALFAIATKTGLRAMARFREIPEDERRELVGDAFARLLQGYPNENWSLALFLSVLTNAARDVVKKLDHRMRRDAVRESSSTDDAPSEYNALAAPNDEFAEVERRREARAMMSRIRPLLSQRDLAWLELVLLGSTHQEIAEQHQVAKAVVDKAMQRAWEKARAAVTRAEGER